jgi:nicotinate-nucleotide--dimethylbenzimidazole phosphoribosyltransferase
MEITTDQNTALTKTLQRIESADQAMLRAAEQRQPHLTKPVGSLGRLEEIANRCAAIFGTLTPSLSRPRIVVFAGDHGVCAEGVSPYPQIVTTQMVVNYLRNGAAINCLANSFGVELRIVDVGVIGPIPEIPGLVRRNVAKGTRNFCQEAAMTAEEMCAAIEVGITMAEEAAADGCNLLGFGEMGIGNTTPASAITAALTGCPVPQSVGRGTGADDECLKRKIAAVERGLALHQAHLSDPFEILRRIGGLEIAAMCGFCLGAAACRKPVLTDGLIATSAAAVAVRINPRVKDFLFAAHASVEPGHKFLMEIIGQRPLLDMGMRLGEGTGAAMAIPLMQGAVAAFTGMATFESAGVATAESKQEQA